MKEIKHTQHSRESKNANEKANGSRLFLPFVIPFFITLTALVPVFHHFFPLVSRKAQVFTDIIIENVAKSGLNKSGELTLFYTLAAGGLLLLCLLGWGIRRTATLLSEKRVSHAPDVAFGEENGCTGFHILTARGGSFPEYTAVLFLPLLLNLCVFGKVNGLLVCALVYFVCLLLYVNLAPSMRSREIPANGQISRYLLLPVLIYYALLGILTVMTQLSSRFILTQNKIYILTGFLTLLSLILIFCLANLLHRKRTTLLMQLMLLLQLFIPFLLVLYFVDKYMYRGSLQTVRYGLFFYLFFGGLLLGLLLHALLHAVKNLSGAAALPCSRLVGLSTVITVFIYNSFSAAPMYAQPDQHHHGEQMIPWQQIFGLGQKAYEDYTPVSGLFPLVNGFIQNVLLGKTVSDYSPAISIMVVLFCILTIYLVYRHVGGAYALLFAIFFALPAYNRQYMVLPVLLFLFLPELLKKPGLWLKCWILSCFLAGLYYPLYGAAVLIATLPLGIQRGICLVRETDWQTELKKPAFYLGWFLCLLPVLCALALLLRMAGHTLTYSGQTILADGISLFGQTAPDYFMPFFAGAQESLRLTLYVCFRFFLPMTGLWLFGYLCFMVWSRRRAMRTLRPANSHTASSILILGLLAGGLTLSISYTYTLVRADTGMILSRTAPVLIAVLGMFLPILLLHYGRDRVPAPVRLLLLGFCLALPMMIYPKVSAMKFPDMWIYPNGEASLLMDDADKLYNHYEVPQTFVKMEEIELTDTSMLGDGFMVADQISYLQQYDSVMRKCSRVQDTTWYMGFDGQGFYYYLNARALATGFIQAAKGYEAQQTILAQAKEKRPVIFLMEPQSTYYVYYWMMTNDYLYCRTDDAFYPAELYAQLYPDSHGDDYRLDCPPTDLGLICNSFGRSYDSLQDLFLDEIEFLPSEHLSITGTDYDFLWLKLNKEQLAMADQLEITFQCDGISYAGASVTCEIGDGQLLIPLGMNADWLCSENSQLRFTFLDGENKPLSSVAYAHLTDSLASQCRFLKLRQ